MIYFKKSLDKNYSILRRRDKNDMLAQQLAEIQLRTEIRSTIFCSHFRIEVHFFCLHWEMKGHRSHVNLVKHEALLRIYTRPVSLYFPMQTKKVYFNPYSYAKVTINPYKSKKQCQFFRRVTNVFHWKIFARMFLCFIAGECHRSVLILNFMV